MTDIEELKKFLIKADMPHATGTADMRKQSNGSRTIFFKEGDWSMEYKNKLTGQAYNYSGREIILENGKEIYWGKYMGGLVDQRFKGSV